MTITYEEYSTDYGGLLSETEYDKNVVKSTWLFDKYHLDFDKTSHRYCAYEMIDSMNWSSTTGERHVTSVNNDGYSVTYSSAYDSDSVENSMVEILKRYGLIGVEWL